MPGFDRFGHLIDRACIALALVGGLGLIAATLVTCLSIVGKLARRGLDALFGASSSPDVVAWITPILGEEEIVQLAVGAALFAALPLAMIRRAHIRVDLFQPLFGDRLNRWLDLVADFSLAVIAYLILTRQWFLIFKAPRGDDPLWGELLLSGNWAEIADRLRSNIESQVIGIPLWPTYVFAQFCVAAFLVVALYCVARSLRAVVRGQSDA